MTIKRVVAPPRDVEAWIRAIRRDPLDEAAAAAIEHQVARRRARIQRER